MYVKGLSIWEIGTYQAAGAEHPTQVTDVGVEGSFPDMLVNHVAPLGFTESNGLIVTGLEVSNSSLVFF